MTRVNSKLGEYKFEQKNIGKLKIKYSTKKSPKNNDYHENVATLNVHCGKPQKNKE